MLRKARAVWRGTGKDGTGHLTTDSGVLHGNQIACVGLERVPRVEMREAVWLNELPIGSARQHRAAQVCSFNCAAGNRHDAAPASSDVSYFNRRADRRAHLENRRQLHAGDSTNH